eukprot:10871316-Ditylum_brightwellii.AAC.1
MSILTMWTGTLKETMLNGGSKNKYNDMLCFEVSVSFLPLLQLLEAFPQVADSPHAAMMQVDGCKMSELSRKGWNPTFVSCDEGEFNHLPYDCPEDENTIFKVNWMRITWSSHLSSLIVSFLKYLV